MNTFSIIIVEDEVIIREYLKSIVKKLGCSVTGETSTGEEAVELAGSGNADLILMDIQLDGKMDGIEAAKKISLTTETPIIFMSAYDYEDKVKDENIPNFIAFMNKPVDMRNLKPILDKLSH